ncbi:E3 ubiquitin-protein ligase XIAP-like isoform X1 [Biomphalaria glabrata]|uniref:E3 ubiquitin-protein ligase XIAP-like isoform X1 n=1 Tax=Biomphalaria glabrata TaxID=6526 RepID=A0A9W3A6M0_BIOGL|nr:E3 ubiquitin-protein ligase XIAP-like isoform X1 [Biomphalaria glabrata]
MSIPDVSVLARIRSYVSYPRSAIMSALALAAAGFEYVGNGNSVTVRCVECGLSMDIVKWMSEDDVQKLHRLSSPSCGFIDNQKKFNKVTKNCAAALSDEGASGESSGNGARATLSAVPRERQARFRYRSNMARMRTFETKRDIFPIDVKKMALCGLYATGEGDSVRCFMCGGGLKNWRRNDDPWIEHIRSYPNCKYVKDQIDKEFYNIVKHLSECFPWLKQITKPMVKQCMERMKAHTKEIRTMMEENDRLGRKLRCRLCGVFLLGIEAVTFQPCGHFVVCSSCGRDIKSCVECGKKIESHITSYLC